MAIKRITVEDSQALLKSIDKDNEKFGVKTEIGKLIGRDACIAAEVVIDAVDAHRAANRKPRAKAGK